MRGGIVIGYEETPQGRDALELGGRFARALAARPLLVNVMPWPGDLAGVADVEAAMEEEAGALLARAAAQLEGLKPETLALANPSPGNALYTTAHETDAVLIVVGSSHRGAIGRVLAGNVARSLLGGAPCAVAVAPRGYADDPPHAVGRVGVAFDGSEEARAALDTAVGLARAEHAAIRLLTVAEPARYGLGTALTILTEAEFRDVEREAKQRALDEALAALPPELERDGSLLEGPPAAAIAEAATDCDLLVLGSRGYGPIRQVLLGDTAGAVIDSARCAVLVVPRAAGPDPLGLAASGGGP
jgi:nucleotide-binding universal stress UspA family protein